ncbi:hypothetical protein LX32DRAFT_189505 [Colletotrichum zoysiae]|uniref:Uncharacterized protein n=1 Tax=Colletotrichum zoysiae TaxID=1216348 RepID=A0AAD9M459_9PEZI|nr:hypothetical protein LX32DRAFT_189505 [Colletotrichum zoysiae]
MNNFKPETSYLDKVSEATKDGPFLDVRWLVAMHSVPRYRLGIKTRGRGVAGRCLVPPKERM